MTLIGTAKRDGELLSTLDELFAEYSPSAIMAAIKNKDIRINGVKTDDKRAFVSSGDEIKVYCADKKRVIYSTVYEDENILVADKESQVSSEGLFEYLLKSGDYRFIHRLDRNTQGLIVFAKNDTYEEILLNAFKKRTADKVYEAVVVGVMPKKADEITAYLVKDETKSIVRVFDSFQKDGAQIKTGYEVVSCDGALSLLSVKLITGKTHQIRAHLSHIGHPILGDEKYGDSKLNAKYKVRRQLLISKSLTFSKTGTYLDGKTFSSAHTNADYIGAKN
jgi:23S rRNA pseudouridine955/2504/2580 synthase